jgi:hypothetical protein
MVGAIGCEFASGLAGLCVDKNIGRQLCVTSGKRHCMMGCSIPSLNGKNMDTELIVLK